MQDSARERAFEMWMQAIPAKAVPGRLLKVSVATVASWHSPLPVASIQEERSDMLMLRSACSLSQKKQPRTPTSIARACSGAAWPLLSAKRLSLSLFSSFPAAPCMPWFTTRLYLIAISCNRATEMLAARKPYWLTHRDRSQGGQVSATHDEWLGRKREKEGGKHLSLLQSRKPSCP